MRKRAAGRDPGLEATQSLGFIVGSCICLVLSLAFAAGVSRETVDPPSPCPGGRINPNNAPVASLARLPGIGLTRARAIVALRSDRQSRQGLEPVFRRAEDLRQIRGIGPATIDSIRPWLHFDPLPGEKNDPLTR